ncbi:MAG TPA: sigma-70 family RNA polymerase sigma factor [Acidimicrobiales bacterium]|nr:sigma-70 family RNA polymerase sigma factor [Acidimicrobiales bacterium]
MRTRSATGDDPVRRYLSELGAHPLLTATEEVSLGRAIVAGDAARDRLADAGAGPLTPAERSTLEHRAAEGAAARQRFISCNLRLVVSIAKRYQSSGLPLLDLIQEGNLGLMRAVDKFDPERGFKFSTYATWWIRQSISRAMADKGRAIRVPAHVGDAIASLARTTAELTRRLDRAPTVAELAEATGLDPDRVITYRHAIRETVSLSVPLGDDSGELADLLADEGAEEPFAAAAAHLEHDALALVLRRLTERERRVLRLRFGLAGGIPWTLEDIGNELDLTRERIRQIEAKALTKLRHPCSPPALRHLVAAGSD